MANSVNPDPIEAVCSGFTLFASILNSSVTLGNYLQQTTSANDIFRYIFILTLKAATYNLQQTNFKCCCFFSKITNKADDSYELSYLIFPKIRKNVAKIVVCCSRSWRFMG